MALCTSKLPGTYLQLSIPVDQGSSCLLGGIPSLSYPPVFSLAISSSRIQLGRTDRVMHGEDMKISNIVHDGRHKSQHRHPDSQTSSEAPSRAPNSTRRDMASALIAYPYSVQQPISKTLYSRSPNPPPSPPVDLSSNCILPSIQSLIGMADGTLSQVSSPSKLPNRGSHAGDLADDS